MRALASIALCVCFVAAAEAQQGEAKIDATLVTKIENQMVMPAGASALKSYRRYYSIGTKAGRRVINGLYSLGSDGLDRFTNATPIEGVPGAFTLRRGDVPLILDGGCGIVEMAFDLATQKPWAFRFSDRNAKTDMTRPTAFCHGLA
ncbi:MAG: hypothetical protein ABI740_00365 [Alphaproteobacteria bacterium]